MTGDRLIHASTAAVVSYSRIYDLGWAEGQDGTAARLLPLCWPRAWERLMVRSIAR
jgi:hypothetical protein